MLSVAFRERGTTDTLFRRRFSILYIRRARNASFTKEKRVTRGFDTYIERFASALKSQGDGVAFLLANAFAYSERLAR